jgi:predicted nucleotidyltransferase
MTIVETLPMKDIARFCRNWQICEFSLFGSALRDDFGPESDLDILITFNESSEWGLLDHVQMQLDLQSLLGRKVDLISQRAVAQSQNQILREEILRTAKIIFSDREGVHAER